MRRRHARAWGRLTVPMPGGSTHEAPEDGLLCFLSAGDHLHETGDQSGDQHKTRFTA